MDESTIIKELTELLKAVRIKPGMYIGKKSLTRLRAFIDGYFYALYKLNGKQEYLCFIPEFQDWIADRYEIRSTHGWSEIINFFSQDEGEAFDTFYELLDEFLLEKRS